MRKVLFFAFIAIAIMSCTSPRERMMETALTRVIILDSYEDVDVVKLNKVGYYKYKVKYIKYDVIDYVMDPQLYDQNDTILVVDKYHNRTIIQ